MGRRSCAEQREAAALISQSRRWSYGRVKGAAARRLFFLAIVRQFSFSLYNFQLSLNHSSKVILFAQRPMIDFQYHIGFFGKLFAVRYYDNAFSQLMCGFLY